MKQYKRIVSVIISIILALSLSACSGAGNAEPSEDTAYDAEDRGFSQEDYYENLESCIKQIREKTDFEPEIALVLGSGLGNYADNIKVEAEIPYSELEGFPDSTTPGHEGSLIFGTYAGKKLVVMKGRIHYNEGYDMQSVVIPIRVMGLLGAKTVILTNAAGSLNPDIVTGEFMAIEDHISSFVPSPLIGENIEKLGDRFVDMTHVYDSELHSLIMQIGEEEGIAVKSGVYLQITGPQFETPTEIKFYQSTGADAIGMSTVVEAIAARHMGMKVCGISNITNMGAGMEDVELSHDMVKNNADRSAEEFTKLVSELIERMPT